MEVIKLGSKGDAVKKLQQALKLKVDGVFGKVTEANVKTFQAIHGLDPDGIVGDATWTALGIKTDTAAVDPSIIYLPLSVHITKAPGREIKYLVIHFTGSGNSKPGRAQNMKNTFTQRPASADFGVDDRDICQYNPNPKNYYCWAVGGKSYGNKGGKYFGKATNHNCISIEMCSTCTPSTSEAVQHDNHEGWSFTEAVLANGIKLAKILMRKYNIDIDHVIRHYDVTGKLCPGIQGWNDEPLKNIDGSKTGKQNNSDEWIKFMEALR